MAVEGARLIVEGHADPGVRVRLAPPNGQAYFGQASPEGVWRIALPSSGEVRLFGLSMIENGRAMQAEGYLAVTPSGDVAQLRSGSGALALAPRGAFSLLALDFDRKGGAILSGKALPGATVAAFVDGAPAGRALTDAAGRYAAPLERPLQPGERTLRVTAGRESAELTVDVSPAAPLDPGPFRAEPAGPLWRVDWMTPGGGVQSTILAPTAAHPRAQS